MKPHHITKNLHNGNITVWFEVILGRTMMCELYVRFNEQLTEVVDCTLLEGTEAYKELVQTARQYLEEKSKGFKK